MRIFAHIFLLLVFLFKLGACVSVDLVPKGPVRSKAYSTDDPKAPFEELENDQADRAWQNPQTGNTFAVISECSDRDPELKAVEADNLNALTNAKILQTQNIEFSDREALRTLAQGQVDGVLVKLDLMIFKKHACVYTLSQLGRDKSFEKDRKEFEAFLKGFRLP
jgi:hypothetical protein